MLSEASRHGAAIATTQPDSTAILDLAGRLRHAIGPLQRQVRQATQAPLTPTQLAILGTIDRHGPIPLSDVATREHLSAATVSEAVAVIEGHGFLKRLADPSDRRVTLVQTSKRGVDWIQRGRADRNGWLALRISELSPDEQSRLAAALPALEKLAQKHA